MGNLQCIKTNQVENVKVSNSNNNLSKYKMSNSLLNKSQSTKIIRQKSSDSTNHISQEDAIYQKESEEKESFQLFNKLLVLEETIVKEKQISQQQLNFILAEYQEIIETLDSINSPLKGYFIQKFQNILANQKTMNLMIKSSKKKQKLDDSLSSRSNSQKSILSNNQLNGSIIENKIEEQNLEKLTERLIDQDQETKQKNAQIQFKLIEDLNKDQNNSNKIIRSYTKQYQENQQVLQKDMSSQISNFQDKLLSRKKNKLANSNKNLWSGLQLK